MLIESEVDTVEMAAPAGISPVILAEDLAVVYKIHVDRPTSLKEYFVRRVKGDLRTREVKALKGVSLRVDKGEVFGVIGRNGAGKSTLLKVISGILTPTSGRIRVWGKVVSLLGVGAGFHPELTGRENVFLYSAILGRGLSRTEELYDEIVDFAELRHFIDTPIRMYSTGMKARLGFAVAMAERPEILLIDEVLAVGDLAFQNKCMARFHRFKDEGSTIIVVSHSMGAVEELCQRAIFLDQGVARKIGEASAVVETYKKQAA